MVTTAALGRDTRYPEPGRRISLAFTRPRLMLLACEVSVTVALFAPAGITIWPGVPLTVYWEPKAARPVRE